MHSKTLPTSLAATIAMLAIVAVVYLELRHREIEAEIRRTREKYSALPNRIAGAEHRVHAAQRQLAVIEQDNARLLDAISSGVVAEAARAMRPRITREMVAERQSRGQEAERVGLHATALTEYLWCYDAGFLRSRAMVQQIARLGERHPAALEALRQRRDEAERRVLASAEEFDAMGDIQAINRVLGEEERTLAAYERLDPNDVRVAALSGSMLSQYVTARRYSDALRLRPFEEMSRSVEEGITRLSVNEASVAARAVRAEAQAAIVRERMKDKSAQTQNDAVDQQRIAVERAKQAQRSALIDSTAVAVEILAGAGELEKAQRLLNKLLAFDSTPETRGVLQKHLERAGHAEMVNRENVGP